MEGHQGWGLCFLDYLMRPVLTVNRGRENTEEEITTSGAGGSEENRN
jgi:hypothetical protein